MVIDDLDIVRRSLLPPEADAELIIEPDAVLAAAVSEERLKLVTGW